MCVCVGLSCFINISHNLFQLNSLCREKEILQSSMRCKTLCIFVVPLRDVKLMKDSRSGVKENVSYSYTLLDKMSPVTDHHQMICGSIDDR